MPGQSFTLTDCATGREIAAQPEIWRRWGKTLARDIAEHRRWIAQSDGEIWLCGAGTSAFIGDLLAAGLGSSGGRRLRPLASTDLVAMPRRYLDRPADAAPPLVVSFGRSGNSAESLGTLDLLDALAPEAPRLNITCNRASALASRPAPVAGRVLVLPETTHDTGFAMTASYSTMLLSALALFDDAAPAPAPRLGRLADAGAALLPCLTDWAASADLPQRMVFLGTGPLCMAAREAALKVLELSAGAVPTLWDSFLGFRHGPKSFVTDRTLVVGFLSADAHTARYEADLLAEMRGQFPKARLVTIGGQSTDFPFETGLEDHWNAVLQVMLAQVLAVFLSARLGLDIDDPFAGRGTLTRVVSGVRLYPLGEA